MKTAILAIVAAIGCGSTSRDAQPAQLDDLRFSVPDGWTHHDTHQASRSISEWTPEANDAKESISVTRTSLRGDVRHADAAALGAMLSAAQRGLPAGQFSPPTTSRTPAGLTALVVDGSFQPPGQHQRYQRVHALVVDGTAIIHVLYTARTPDPDLRTFHLVLDTLHREQG